MAYIIPSDNEVPVRFDREKSSVQTWVGDDDDRNGHLSLIELRVKNAEDVTRLENEVRELDQSLVEVSFRMQAVIADRNAAYSERQSARKRLREAQDRAFSGLAFDDSSG